MPAPLLRRQDILPKAYPRGGALEPFSPPRPEGFIGRRLAANFAIWPGKRLPSVAERTNSHMASLREQLTANEHLEIRKTILENDSRLNDPGFPADWRTDYCLTCRQYFEAYEGIRSHDEHPCIGNHECYLDPYRADRDEWEEVFRTLDLSKDY
jgi:hypothetical protein